ESRRVGIWRLDDNGVVALVERLDASVHSRGEANRVAGRLAVRPKPRGQTRGRRSRERRSFGTRSLPSADQGEAFAIDVDVPDEGAKVESVPEPVKPLPEQRHTPSSRCDH